MKSFVVTRYGPTGQAVGVFRGADQDAAVVAAVTSDAKRGRDVDRAVAVPLELHNARARAMQAADVLGGWDAAMAAMRKFNRDHGLG